MGLDVAYTKISGMSTSNGFLAVPSVTPAQRRPLPTGTTLAQNVDDQDNWQFRFRVHRDFYP